MIPFQYRLRKGVRFQRRADSCIVISEAPLNVVRASRRAIRILKSCDGQATVRQIAGTVGMSEDQVFVICDYFNKKAILEIEPVRNKGYFPYVTIIIPVKDRADELSDCLQSVVDQDYPTDRLELIVIDDGSKDRTSEVASRFPCKLIRNGSSRGQSACRNLGAAEASGEILAFMDSDCVASKTWLKELVIYFEWDQIGAVGGYVDGYFEESGLDRYEKACSSLTLGKHMLYERDHRSTFYVPTCNLLVRKSIYHENGGITESLRVGEDVDFCWRMRGRGKSLIYVPKGVVLHKHRNNLMKMLKRRADYGTSEALLYSQHGEKKKILQAPPSAAAAFLALLSALVFWSFIPAALAAAFLGYEAGRKIRSLKRMSLSVPAWRILFSVIRTHLSFFYCASFHIVRYYLLCFFLAGMLLPAFWSLGLVMLVYAALVDYALKRPQLSFGIFFLYYSLEHLGYQVGVAAGCIRARTLSAYRSTFKGNLMLHTK